MQQHTNIFDGLENNFNWMKKIREKLWYSDLCKL